MGHVCGYMFDDGSYCGAPASHVFQGLWWCDKHIDEAFDHQLGFCCEDGTYDEPWSAQFNRD